jgi:hypothetical protein
MVKLLRVQLDASMQFDSILIGCLLKGVVERYNISQYLELESPFIDFFFCSSDNTIDTILDDYFIRV